MKKFKLSNDLKKPAKQYNNQFIEFVGYRIFSDSSKQEIEYHFNIKGTPQGRFYFFEHFEDSNNGFYPHPWRNYDSSKIWQNSETLLIKTSHSLKPAEYSLFVGFANTEDTSIRLEFSGASENRIPVGSVKFNKT